MTTTSAEEEECAFRYGNAPGNDARCCLLRSEHRPDDDHEFLSPSDHP